MDQIKHTYIQVDRLKLHVAEIGSESSPTVLFLHGFLEISYTWRHQMIAVANAGFRAIAPDYRGYGLSDVPAKPEKTSFADLVADTAAILDSLSISKVFVIAKDFGAMVGYIFSLFFPEKLAGIITLGIPYMPPEALQQLQTLPREPGRAEADFGRFDAKTVVRKIYILFSRSEVPIASESQEIMDLVEQSAPLPSWFTEEDLDTYAASYQKSGFLTALQVPYRSLLERVEPPNHDPNAPIVTAPALFVTGEKDFFFSFPGMEEYLQGGIQKYVPNLEIIYLPEGSHFVHEQFPETVNQLLLNFLKSNKSLLERVEPPNHDPNAPIVTAPALFVTGEKDFFFSFPGMEEYLQGGIQKYVPNLEIIYLPEGSHFVHEQFPETR
ncbi:hypothetical protein OSB04_001898 [Centaurea solstitialis]|uniref:AB hydrolase-1 domain-containing protein n=1 Tax=Centaurea solstitialis TaxID=347529 RepID=A0AA38U9Y8_9ASTR|nr:hypothetical protein OSB04_001898 [Centaurea solstitialis]